MSETADSPEGRAQQLASILEAQLALYGNVRELSEHQQAMISEEDTEGLMTLLAEKQRLISAIESLGREAEPLRAAWDTERDGLSPATRQPVETAVASLRDTLAAIMALEDAGQGALGQARDSAGHDIAKLQKGKALHKAYGGKKPAPNARFKDKNA